MTEDVSKTHGDKYDKTEVIRWPDVKYRTATNRDRYYYIMESGNKKFDPPYTSTRQHYVSGLYTLFKEA
jgi:hypothetical protein